MAPWTPRSVASRPKKPSVAEQAASSSTTPTRDHLHSAPEAYLDQAYSIPTLQFDRPDRSPGDGIDRSRPGNTRNGHGRSMSHPFPSLFSGKKRRESAAGLESTDEEPSSPQKVNSGKGARVHDADLVTGKCMTCDSTVRWPKELSVFRCVVCLTINDLKPIERRSSNGKGAIRSAEKCEQLHLSHKLLLICVSETALRRLCNCYYRKVYSIISSGPIDTLRKRSRASRIY